MKRIIGILFVLLLAACGGGGGGGSAGPSISLNKSSLQFSGIEGSVIASQTIRATASNLDSAVYVGAVVNGQGISSPLNVNVNSTTGTADITVTPETGLSAGNYSGTIQLLACYDENCTRHIAGSPFSVPYSVTINPNIKVSPASVNLTATETGSSSIVPVTMTMPNATTNVRVDQIKYAGSASGWLQAQISGNTLNLQASAASLGQGSYTATVILRDNVGNINYLKEVPVSLVVSNGLQVQAAVSLNLRNDTASTQGSHPISIAAGSSASGWTASSDAAWLKLDNSSGNFSQPLNWRLDLAAVAALENSASHTANITVSAGTGITPVTVKFSLDKKLAQISAIDSLALLPGKGGDVLVYGSNFDSLSNPASAISVAGATPSNVQRLNERMLKVTLPALTAGNYEFSTPTASGITLPKTTLYVLNKQTYSYQAIDTAGQKNVAVWDAVSKSLFTVDGILNRIVKFSETNGSFAITRTQAISGTIDSIALNRDRSSLVVMAGSTVLKLSPADLSTQTSIALPQYSGYAPSYSGNPLVITGDNQLLTKIFGFVDLATGKRTALKFNGNASGDYDDSAAISGDGSRMLQSPSGRYSPRGPVYWFDLLTQTFTPFSRTPVEFFYRHLANYDGSSWLLENNAIYGFDMSIKGQLTLPDTNWFTDDSAISRDGSRVYVLAMNSAAIGTYSEPTTIYKPRIYVFNTSTIPTSGTSYPVIGYFELNDYASCRVSYLDTCAPYGTRMVLADDDQTLFFAGDRKFIVAPIPSAYLPPPPNSFVTKMPVMRAMRR